MLVLASFVSGAVYYEADFESPTYSVGNLFGQDSWTGTVNTSTISIVSGQQVRLGGSTTVRSLHRDVTIGNPEFEVIIDINFSTFNPTAITNLIEVLDGTTRQVIIGCEADEDMRALNGSSSTTIKTNGCTGVIELKMVVNDTSNTYDVYIDNVLKADDFSFFNVGGQSNRVELYMSGLSSGVYYYMDNLTVQSIGSTPVTNKTACFGDSITAGNGLLAGEDYCSLIGDTGLFETFNEGVAGKTSQDLRDTYVTNLLNQGYNYTILLVGTNDLAWNKTPDIFVNISQYYENLINITDELLNDGQQVVISTIPPCNDSVTGTSLRNCTNGNTTFVEQRNRIVRNVSFEQNLCYADIFNDVFGGSWDSVDFQTNDGVHPNANSHEAMNSTYLDAIDNCVSYNCTANPSQCDSSFPIIYPLNVPSNVTVETGTVDDGNITSVQLEDGLSLNISEVGSSPGFNISFDFLNWTSFNKIRFVDYYNGNLGHTINVNLLNISGNWVTIGNVVDMVGFENVSYNISDYSVFNNSGVINMRIVHTSSGNLTHDYFIDNIILENIVPVVDSNITNVNLLSVDSCTVSSPINFNGTFSCVGDTNCSGSYNYTVTSSCSVFSGGNGTFNIENGTSFNNLIQYVCTVATSYDFNFTVINTGDLLQYDNLTKSCSGGTGSGLTPEESEALIGIWEVVQLLAIIFLALGILAIGEWKDSILLRFGSGFIFMFLAFLNWMTATTWQYGLATILIGFAIWLRALARYLVQAKQMKSEYDD